MYGPEAVRDALDPRAARFQALFFVQFAAFSGFAVFRNVYLEEIGLTGGQMGLIGAVMTMAGVLAQPVWGVVTDELNAAKPALVVGAAVSAVGILAYPASERLAEPFLFLLAGTAVYAAFRAPIVPVANAMVLGRGIDYGNVRAFGSVAFGIGSLLFGALVSSLGVPVIVYAYVAGMAVLVVVAWGLPAETEGRDGPSVPPLTLLRSRGFLLLLAVSFVLGASLRGGSAFFSVYMRAVGSGDALTGAAWAVKTVFEAVAFVYALRVARSYTALLVFGAAGTALQFLVYWLTAAPVFVVAVQAAAGLGYAAFYLGAVNLAHEVAPDDLRATAQTVLAGAGLGAGGALGQVVAGSLTDMYGVQEMYVYLAAIGFAAAALATLVRFVEQEP